MEEDLKKYGLSMESPHSLVSVLHTIDETGRDPKTILSELARLKSVRQAEMRLKKNCKMWELRAARYKEIIPLCEQIVRFGIGFPELAALHAAVLKKADLENLPMTTAAYSVMEDIEKYNKLGGMNEQLIKMGIQLCVIEGILGRKNTAINAMMKLQSLGVTDNEIFNFHEFLNSARQQRGQLTS